MVVADGLRQRLDLCHAREIGHVALDVSATGQAGEGRGDLFELRRVAPMQQDVVAPGDEHPGRLKADAIRGARDQDALLHGMSFLLLCARRVLPEPARSG